MQCVVAMMSATPTIVLENGTMLGAMSEQRKLQPQAFVVPEIVISGSHSHIHSHSESSSSLHCSRSRNDNLEEVPAESTALLEQQQHQPHAMPTGGAEEDTEFEQFILNRTTSESNMLESSIYSELQFSSASAVAAGANVTAPAAVSAAALNASVCSRSDSRQSKRTRRKSHKSKAKCSSSNVAVGVGVGVGVPGVGAGTGAAAGSVAGAPPVGSYPPQYTAIFLDPHHHHHAGAAANALATAAAASPFLNSNPESAANFLQYHQFYQQRPMGMAHPHQHPHPHPHHHHLRR